MTTPEFLDPDDLLDDVLAGVEPDFDDDPEPPPDAHRADQLLFRLARLRGDRARSREAAERRLEQIVAWQAEREGVYLRQEEWLLAALGRYHAAVLELRPTAKSINLPSGDLVSRMSQPEWTVDEPTVLAWALPEALATTLRHARDTYFQLLEAVAADEHAPGVLDVLSVKLPPEPVLSRSGLKEYGTRYAGEARKRKAVAWGVTPDGEAIPGVTVTPGRRTFDVRLRGEDDEREEVTPEEWTRLDPAPDAGKPLDLIALDPDEVITYPLNDEETP